MPGGTSTIGAGDDSAGWSPGRRYPRRYRGGRDAGTGRGATVCAKDGEQSVREGAGVEAAGVGPDDRAAFTALAGRILTALRPDPRGALEQGGRQYGEIR